MWTALPFFLIALLYSSVGHAGASGYLALMALLGTTPDTMRASALGLNVLVASIATLRFARARALPADLFWPLALTSCPLAFIGAQIPLDRSLYYPLIGGVLAFAAIHLLRPMPTDTPPKPQRAVRLPALATCGAGLGFLSGLTGVGGGIFLSPLMLALGWSAPRNLSGLAAAFILVNSLAGLAGLWPGPLPWADALPLWAVAVIVGGYVGSGLGSRNLPAHAIRRLLAIVVGIAAIKMLGGF